MNPFPFLTFVLVALTVAIGEMIWDHLSTPAKWWKVLLVSIVIVIIHAT